MKPQLKKIGIVIPTRNRREELTNVLQCIMDQDCKINEVIVVDSSDLELTPPNFAKTETKFSYIYTNIRSAAEQRNIGKRSLNSEIDFIAFLDDDISIERDYLSKLLDIFASSDVIGASGVAINRKLSKRRTKPFGFSGFIHKLFLLDSNKDGILLKSGVNIPIRSDKSEENVVDWLIGCAMWRSFSIKDLEFESDFKGQSLAEDVIFSVRAGERGKLITNPSIIINHYESEIERPNKVAHYQMWVVNRRRLIQVMGGGLARLFAFQLANLGQALIFVYVGLKGDRSNFNVAKQIFMSSFKSGK